MQRMPVVGKLLQKPDKKNPCLIEIKAYLSHITEETDCPIVAKQKHFVYFDHKRL